MVSQSGLNSCLGANCRILGSRKEPKKGAIIWSLHKIFLSGRAKNVKRFFGNFETYTKYYGKVLRIWEGYKL